MSVYMFQAAFYCEDCGGKLPQEPQEGGPYDSDEYAISYPDAGEADSPQHCDSCGTMLDHSLTPEGEEYVREALADPDGFKYATDPTLREQWAALVD